MSTRSNRRRGGLLLVTALTAGAILAVPLAGGAEEIAACVHKKRGTVRIAQTCRRNETRISWNRQGPQGPAGVANIQRVDFSSRSDTVPRKSAFAHCPAGTTVIGGGAQILYASGMSGPVALKQSVPSAKKDGWAATAESMDPGFSGAWFITAYALCATLSQ